MRHVYVYVELTLVANRRVRSQHRLLGALGLELGQDGTRNVQAGNHVVLGQFEAEALGVVVDVVDFLELEANEALLPAGKGLLGFGAHGFADLRLGLLGGGRAGQEVVARTGGAEGDGRVG